VSVHEARGGAVIAALAGFWLLVQSPLAFAAGPDCLRGFITELRKAVADQDEAEDMFARITIFSDDGARGATMAIQQVRGDRFAVLWRTWMSSRGSDGTVCQGRRGIRGLRETR
jgi:hypothetical protein